MFTYLAKFIPNMAQITSPLCKLLSMKVSFAWGEEQKLAFQKLKELICRAPVLRYYNDKNPLILSVVASSHGLSVVVL